MPTSIPLHPWHSQLGSQRDWVWRGWQVRYTYFRAEQPNEADDNIPIVFLHGFGAALTQWRLNLSVLSQRHTVYALDFLGFGASEKAAAEFKVGLWVEQVRDFCQTFIGQPVILIGHSLGALVALATANAHPSLVRGLTLLTLPASRQELLPAGVQRVVGNIEAMFSNRLLIKLVFWLVQQPAFIRAALQKIYVNPDAITDDLIASFALPAQDRGAGKVLYRLVQARTRTDFSPSTKSLLAELQVPILLLWGEQDQIIPLKWGRQLVSLTANLKMVELPGVGHCSYDECAERVNHEIETWIDLCVKHDPNNPN